MSKRSFPNPDFAPWRPEDQSAYLKYAREAYARKCGNPLVECTNWRYWSEHRRGQRCPACPPPHKARKNVLEALYFDGRIRGYLRLTFQEFEARVISGDPRLYRKFGHHYRSRDGVLIVKKPSKYVRSTIPRPEMTPDENELHQRRRDWRAHKGFEKDFRRRRFSHGSRKRWAKQVSNRLHRQWERRQIQRQKWDDQISDIRKWTHDPWMWD